MKRGRVFCAMIVLWAVASALAVITECEAAVPRKMNYQGKLTAPGGTLVADGAYDMVFSLYDAETGGTEEWTETWDSGTSQVQVTNGLFNVLLGTHVPVNPPFDEGYWLEMRVKNGVSYESLAPRQEIVSAAYALRADAVTDGAITNASVSASAAIADTKLATISTSGKVSGSAVSGGALGAVDGSAITDLSAGNVSSGTLGAARLPAGGEWALGSALGITGGNVGIGTASPGAALDVSGIARANSLRLNTSYYLDTDAYLDYGGYGDVNHRFYYNGGDFHAHWDYYGKLTVRDTQDGADRVHIDTNGNVGIGTTVPNARLDVNGDIAFNGTTMRQIRGQISNINPDGGNGYGYCSFPAYVLDTSKAVCTATMRDTGYGGALIAGTMVDSQNFLYRVNGRTSGQVQCICIEWR